MRSQSRLPPCIIRCSFKMSMCRELHVVILDYLQGLIPANVLRVHNRRGIGTISSSLSLSFVAMRVLQEFRGCQIGSCIRNLQKKEVQYKTCHIFKFFLRNMHVNDRHEFISQKLGGCRLRRCLTETE
jgi:hypothetical protein